MVKLVTMPTTPNFVESRFSLVRTIGVTMSPFTAKTKTQEFDGVYWTAEVTLPAMKRVTAVEWQSFLLETNGQANYFEFGDPDAGTNRGSYDTAYLIADKRIDDASETLTFAANGTITAATAIYGSLRVGDYIHITGAVNEINNGTHKITTHTSTTVVIVDTLLVAESNTASCKVRQNIKGSTALSLLASTNASTGTILKGDYLGVLSSNSATAEPAQLLMVTEDATVTSAGGSAKDFISVRTQPKLRADLTEGHFVKFTAPKGKFRLTTNEVDWSANNVSNYGLGFSCIEVV